MIRFGFLIFSLVFCPVCFMIHKFIKFRHTVNKPYMGWFSLPVRSFATWVTWVTCIRVALEMSCKYPDFYPRNGYESDDFGQKTKAKLGYSVTMSRYTCHKPLIISVEYSKIMKTYVSQVSTLRQSILVVNGKNVEAYASIRISRLMTAPRNEWVIRLRSSFSA